MGYVSLSPMPLTMIWLQGHARAGRLSLDARKKSFAARALLAPPRYDAAISNMRSPGQLDKEFGPQSAPSVVRRQLSLRYGV